jgi:hypothetical protein
MLPTESRAGFAGPLLCGHTRLYGPFFAINQIAPNNSEILLLFRARAISPSIRLSRQTEV